MESKITAIVKRAEGESIPAVSFESHVDGLTMSEIGFMFGALGRALMHVMANISNR